GRRQPGVRRLRRRRPPGRPGRAGRPRGHVGPGRPARRLAGACGRDPGPLRRDGDRAALMEVAGAKVVVTGASSGIGAALAPVLRARGARVGIVARREDRLAAVLDACRAHVPGCRMWVADLGDTDRAAALAVEMDDTLGGIDVLVNNAAIPKRRSATDITV